MKDAADAAENARGALAGGSLSATGGPADEI